MDAALPHTPADLAARAKARARHWRLSCAGRENRSHSGTRLRAVSLAIPPLSHLQVKLRRRCSSSKSSGALSDAL